MQVYKDPEPHYPIAFEITTVSNQHPPNKPLSQDVDIQVISEDWLDNSFDDCTVKVLQYKEPEYPQTWNQCTISTITPLGIVVSCEWNQMFCYCVSNQRAHWQKSSLESRGYCYTQYANFNVLINDCLAP